MTDAADGVLFFETPEALRRWFDANHDSAEEQWIGYFKKKSGVASITWPESVDEALCVGWIDGLRRSIDAKRYKIRFTPRRPKSIWSKVNVERVAVLTKEGRMREAGLAAYAKLEENKSGVYGYEQGKNAVFSEAFAARLAADAEAQAGWDKQPPSYRRLATFWVMSAKREATRERRMGVLIESSAEGLKIPSMRPRKGKK